MTDWNETAKPESKEVKLESENPKEVKTTGIQSIQGIEKSKPAADRDTAVPQQSSPEEIEFPGPPAPSELKYELGSPHKDYQAYKDLQAAKRQHELGQQAATIGPEPGVSTFFEAAANTLSARKEAQGSDETAMDEYFYKKYGRAPYTTDAYPKLTEEDQPQSYTDEDILIDEMNQLREQQEKDLQDDLEKFKNRPKPPYYKE